jgi:hypothetical protein
MSGLGLNEVARLLDPDHQDRTRRKLAARISKYNGDHEDQKIQPALEPGQGGQHLFQTPDLFKILNEGERTTVSALLVPSAAATSASVPTLPPPGKVSDGARPSKSVRAGAAADYLFSPSSEKVEARTQAWHEILAALQATGLPTLSDFTVLYNANQIEVSAQARELEPTLSVETLERWIKLARKDQLVCRYGNRRGDTVFARNPKLAKYVSKHRSANPRIRAARLYEAVLFEFPQVKISIGTVTDELRRLQKKDPALNQYLLDKDKYKSKFGVAVGSASAGLGRIGAHIQVDGTRLEVFYLDEDGKPARAHLNVAIEPVSRFVWVYLSRTPSAEATVALVRKGFSLIGVMDEVLSDWGMENLNRHVRRAIVRFLKIRWRKVARPYSGELKAFVERMISTLVHRFAEVFAGFSGHSPLQAAEIRNQYSFQERRGERRNLIKLHNVKLSFEQLADLLENCVTIYNSERHSQTKQIPAQAIADAKAAGQLRFLSAQDEQALDLLLGAGGAAVVGKKGIRIDGAFYWDDTLIPYRGRRVEFVKLRDMGCASLYIPLMTLRFSSASREIPRLRA